MAGEPRPKSGTRKPKRTPAPWSTPADLNVAVDVVRSRSGGWCERDGCDRRAQVFHHRRGRGPGCHHPDLLAHLCEADHLWVHAHPTESYRLGLMVRRVR